MGKIILFYKYVSIPTPNIIKKWQKKLCSELGVKGRIIIAQEGINATLGGSEASINAYIQAMNEHELFGDIDFKTSPGNAEFFPRLSIVVRTEVVTLGIDPRNLSSENTAEHLNPKQTHELLEKEPENLVVLDARNNYESRIGTFKNAITPDIKNFRDFPEYVDNNLEQFKGKDVLMFCTGGIRCERASAYLKEKNVASNVMQVEGGIHRYVEQYPDGFFRGKNYVFDARVAVKVNDDILGNCDICEKPCNDYTNCVNSFCNKHYLACKNCFTQYNNTCSAQCMQLVADKKVVIRKKPLFSHPAEPNNGEAKK